MATDGRQIETPFGPKVERLWERLEILGISSYITQTLNRTRDLLQLHELVNIDVPAGTLAIIPSPNYWLLGHGSLSPERLDPLDDNQLTDWNSSDRPWGIGWVSVSVVDINEPDFSVTPPAQSAQLLINIHLGDYNLDDSYFGKVGYTLMFLGKPARNVDTASLGSTVFPTPPETGQGLGPSSAGASTRFTWQNKKVR